MLDLRSETELGVGETSKSREQALSTIVGQLSNRGILESRRGELPTSSDIRFLPTGSDLNVAIIPADINDAARVLKFTDSLAASAELATSSNIQQQLIADTRLSSWSSHVPRVLASGVIETTTFAIEECLSSRDGRALASDPAATSALIQDALAVIDDFHRVSARRQPVDASILASVVDRPVNDLRLNTPVGPFRSRARLIERLAKWLRQSLVDHEVETGWTHGDFHLGNVLIDDAGSHVIGVVDWGRAEPDGLTVLDGLTLVVLERAKSAGEEIGPFLLELLSDVGLAQPDRKHPEVIDEIEALRFGEPGVDLRCLLLLTWLKHVTNNLKFEDRTRSHGLWRLRTVDLVLFGAIEIVGY